MGYYHLYDTYYLYDIDRCKEAIQKIKDFPRTVHKKAEHKYKVFELKSLIESFNDINKYLFEPEYISTFSSYYNAINIYYSSITKEELDRKFKACLADVSKQLQDCINTEYLIQTGDLIEYKPGQYADKETIENYIKVGILPKDYEVKR